MAHVNVLAAFFPGFLQLNRFPDFAAFFGDFSPAMFSRVLQGPSDNRTGLSSAAPAEGLASQKPHRNE
jgi:hypothetical protein